ncbi:hypothetical protein NW762_013484 [Fusarium torreyae]|uniref:Uncharacterized protein n=1 Tax=Fusarium torreyae TaxID=1237075 RepID=A0A9W8RPK9_9HYPO|nr:hypothetical protein NW762_013484 [Fusarium torreyae]
MASIARLMRPLRQCRFMRPAVTRFARPAPIVAAQNRRFQSTDATEDTEATSDVVAEATESTATTEAINEAHDIIKATTEIIAEATEATQTLNTSEATDSTVETIEREHHKSKYKKGWATEARRRLNYINYLKGKYGSLPEHVEAQRQAVTHFFGLNLVKMITGREGFVSRLALDKQHVAYGDMDISVGRASVAALSRYAETSRMNWFTWFMNHEGPKKFWASILKPSTVELILIRQILDFRRAITYPDRLTVMHKLAVMPDENKTQIPTQVIIFSDNQHRIVARSQEQLLYVQKGQHRQSGPLPKQVLTTLQKWWNKQERASVEAEKMIDDFHEMLAKLEADLPKDFWPEKAVNEKEEAEKQDKYKDYTLPDFE